MADSVRRIMKYASRNGKIITTKLSGHADMFH